MHLRFWETSLTARLVSVYLLLSLAVVCMLGIATYLSVRSTLTEASLNSLETAALLEKDRVERWLDSLFQEMQIVCKAPSYHLYLRKFLNSPENSPERKEAHSIIARDLRLITLYKPDFSELMILNPQNGKVLISSDPESEGFFKYTMNYFIKGKKEAVLEPVYLSFETLDPTLTMAIPILDENSDPLCVFVAHINMQQFDAILRIHTGTNKTKETYLVDKYHGLISGFQEKKESGKNISMIDSDAIRLKVYTEGANRALAGNSGYGMYLNYDNVPVLGVYHYLPKIEVALMAEVSQEEAFAPAKRFFFYNLWIGIGAAAALGFGMFKISQRIVKPVRAITNAAQSMIQGKWNVRAPVTTRDEIGLLAKSYNKMAEKISTLYSELKNREEYFRSLIEHTSELILVINQENLIAYSSPSVHKYLGYSSCELENCDFSDLIYQDDLILMNRRIQEVNDEKNPSPLEIRIKNSAGEFQFFEANVTELMDNTAIGGIVINAWDITPRKNVEERLEHTAHHDALTALPNRLFFMDRLCRLIEFSKRNPDYLFAVLYMDLDRFKAVNDSLGHLAGDKLLKESGRRISKCVRGEDTTARLGGDEFTVILENLHSPAEATKVCERILKSLNTVFYLDDQEVYISSSIGIAFSSAGYEYADDIIRDADAALFRAKNAGRGRYEIFDKSMHEQALEQLKLETELQAALDNEQFELFYQPVYSRKEKKLLGMDASICWYHPTKGSLYPENFVPLANELGLIQSIDFWALRQACKDLRAWLDAGARQDLHLTLDISSKFFINPNFSLQIQELTAEFSINPGFLRFVLQDKAFLLHPENSREQLQRLKDMGIQIIIDGGSWYSVFESRQDSMVDMFRVNMNNISKLTSTENEIMFLSSLTKLAASVGMEVLMVGVDKPEQMEELKRVYYDQIKGNVLSPVMDFETSKTFLVKAK